MVRSRAPDKLFFGRLGVYPTASAEEIWFGYFLKVYEYLKGRARDVTENNTSISALLKRFIEESSDDARLKDLTEAYQVLSDPETREAYVRYGTRPGSASLVHYSVILQMVFGSEAFQNYVGTMRLDSLAAVMEEDAHLSTMDLRNRVLAKNAALLEDKVKCLADFMKPILDLTSTDFRTRAQEEAEGVLQGNTAPPNALCRDMLKTIGPIYKSNAAKLRLTRDEAQAADPQESRTCQKDAALWEVCRKVLADLTGREKKKRAKKLKEFGQILENIGRRMGENRRSDFCCTLPRTNHRV